MGSKITVYPTTIGVVVHGLVLINKVNGRKARSVLDGWLSADRKTIPIRSQVNSAWPSIHPSVGTMSTCESWSVNRHNPLAQCQWSRQAKWRCHCWQFKTTLATMPLTTDFYIDWIAYIIGVQCICTSCKLRKWLASEKRWMKTALACPSVLVAEKWRNACRWKVTCIGLWKQVKKAAIVDLLLYMPLQSGT